MTEGWARRCPVCETDRDREDFRYGHKPCRLCRNARQAKLARLRRCGISTKWQHPSWRAPEKTARLLALADEGLPRHEIAARMGITHNAVIGRLHRLGLTAKKIPEQAIPSLWDRLQALHDKMDAVLEETHFIGMYLPRPEQKSEEHRR